MVSSIPRRVFRIQRRKLEKSDLESPFATGKREAASPALDNLAFPASAITTTLKTVEGYVHYGIND